MHRWTDELAALRDRPVPEQSRARSAKANFRAVPISSRDPMAQDSAPSLVEAKAVGLRGRNHYAHDDNPPYWGAIEGAIDALWMRPAVAERLRRIDARLAPAGLSVFLLDAWRPRAVQAYFHDVWMPQRLHSTRPDLQGAALWQEVERYWSAPTNDAASPAPHETGAAVDVVIVHLSGQDGMGGVLFMGSVFDDPTPLAAPDHYEAATLAQLPPTGEKSGFAPSEGGPAAMSLSHEEARANRRLLYWLMTEEGFAAHPDEWWHFSFGDQMWAALTGAPAALYGLAAPPTL